MSGSEPSLTVALVVATRSRAAEIAKRLPFWTSASFDEVIIVDGTYDAATRAGTRALCERHGATWVGAPLHLGDTRSLQRNLGASVARSTWIHFSDDDDDAIASLNRESLRRAARDRDWLVGPEGVHIVLHRRDAFLAIGGYPEDMVAAEDGIMSNRARAHGKGGLVTNLYDKLVELPPAKEDPISRARNGFFYGYTSLLLFLRYPRPKDIVLGEARRVLAQVREGRRHARYLWCAFLRVFGQLLSPVHCLRVLLASGPGALRREPYADWQGLR